MAEENLEHGVSVNEATHVKTGPGQYEKIASKWGVEENGRLAKPSEGGFGVVTESGKRINMWQARAYAKEKK